MNSQPYPSQAVDVHSTCGSSCTRSYVFPLFHPSLFPSCPFHSSLNHSHFHLDKSSHWLSRGRRCMYECKCKMGKAVGTPHTYLASLSPQSWPSVAETNEFREQPNPARPDSMATTQNTARAAYACGHQPDSSPIGGNAWAIWPDPGWRLAEYLIPHDQLPDESGLNYPTQPET